MTKEFSELERVCAKISDTAANLDRTSREMEAALAYNETPALRALRSEIQRQESFAYRTCRELLNGNLPLTMTSHSTMEGALTATIRGAEKSISKLERQYKDRHPDE